MHHHNHPPYPSIGGSTNHPYPPPPGAYPPGGYPPPPGAYPPGAPPPGAYPPPTQPGAPPGYFPPPHNVHPPHQAAPDMEFIQPRLPFNEKLGNRLQDGTIIKLVGHVPHNADRFHVNLHLKKGYHETVDAAIHINPRLPEGTIVRNSFLHSSWGTEETHGFMPLTRGSNFECIILSTPVEYRVAFNGAHFCEYQHRVAMDKVKALFIDGDVVIHRVTVTSPSHQPPPPNPYPPPGPFPPGPVYNLPIPYKNYIYNGGFVPGRKVIVQGVANNNSGRFHVNFQYFQHDANDIAFHFNPRFDEHEVVMNTLTGHSWGREKRPKHFPFAVGVHFAIEFECTRDKIKVTVNGTHFSDYDHRLKNLKHIEHIVVTGDVLLSHVDVL